MKTKTITTPWEAAGLSPEERAREVVHKDEDSAWQPIGSREDDITAAIRVAVAEAESDRDYIAECCDDAGSPRTSGDGEITVGIVGRVEWMRDRIAELQAAVAAETERCARVADAASEASFKMAGALDGIGPLTYSAADVQRNRAREAMNIARDIRATRHPSAASGGDDE